MTFVPFVSILIACDFHDCRSKMILGRFLSWLLFDLWMDLIFFWWSKLNSVRVHEIHINHSSLVLMLDFFSRILNIVIKIQFEKKLTLSNFPIRMFFYFTFFSKYVFCCFSKLYLDQLLQFSILFLKQLYGYKICLSIPKYISFN